MGTIFFTHVPKTAGTSLCKSLFCKNLPDGQTRRARGFKDLIFDRSPFRYLHGHYPYGIHKIASAYAPPRYFVMLRDPVERALSFYHNILYPRDGGTFKHPSLEDARNRDVFDFYRLPRYQNMQARIVAGMFFYKLGAYCSLDQAKHLVLSVAKHNLLHGYEAFGLTEHYDQSAQLFACKLGWTYQPTEKRYKRVPDRPTTADLTLEQIQTLRRLNAIDVALYETAQEHFGAQL